MKFYKKFFLGNNVIVIVNPWLLSQFALNFPITKDEFKQNPNSLQARFERSFST